ncbi:DHH family phosphoesterase [Candidatus Nomurabacteria bacterium]|nr:DHH family phosphoesterase [Candidatus Saccharibacteria bacterium]MCB9839763.1 DHH family phosphoesterase [Candidatus Nomurabacteria bacterium]
MIPNKDEIKEFIEKHDKFLIIQADNPDGDSIATSLALNEILTDMGKTAYLYCAVEVPGYLKFLNGWDKISSTIPADFSASLIVDTSTIKLLENLTQQIEFSWVQSKPTLVLDHHQEVNCDISFATVVSNAQNFASTGEVVYQLAKDFGWPLSLKAMEYATQSILSDSLGLTSDIAGSNTYRRVADMLEAGVSRSKLEETRRELSKMDIEVFRYKADLIDRTEFFYDNQIALVVIPESELYDIGTLYNPGPLIMSELLNVKDVKLAVALKVYKNRLTGALRCSAGIEIANKLASIYGGGGHPYAAGFRQDNFCEDIDAFKYNLVKQAIDLLK